MLQVAAAYWLVEMADLPMDLPATAYSDIPSQLGPAVRRDLKYGADWIKLSATGGVATVLSDFDTQELSEEQMAKAV